MLTFPLPHELQGRTLEDALVAAGHIRAVVTVANGELVVGGVDADDRASVEAVIGSHKPASSTDPDDALRDAIASATTLDQLKGALIGSGGKPARVAGRPTQ